MTIETQQEQAAFEQAFASVSGEPYEAPTVAPEAAAEAEQEPPAAPQVAEPKAEPAEPEQPAEPAAATSEEGQVPAAPAEDDDPVLLDGLRRSELHRLLANAAEVETLKRMVDKAHGNVGDLKRQLQQLQQQPPAAKPQAAALPQNMQAFEQDYPEIAQYVSFMAAGRPTEPVHQAEPASAAQATQPEQPEQPGQPAHDPLAIEMAVMDRLHQGWRETLRSDEFGTWLGSRELAVQQAFATAQTADEMGAVLTQFQQWSTARTAAAEASAKGQQRLRAAVTPTGNAPRPQAALTEDEAMQAAFNAVMGR